MLIRNWKTVAFAVALALLTFTGWQLYAAGSAAATQRHQIATLQAELSTLNAVLKIQNAALKEDQIRAINDTEAIAALNGKIIDLHAYAETLKDGSRECLSGPDVNRLRSLWVEP